MSAPDRWRLRRLTLEAALFLVLARLTEALLPFRWWRGRLGGQSGSGIPADAAVARRLAAHVERAAMRLPLATRCLHRAMALSAMLRRRDIAHRLILAARPAEHRNAGEDDLHAWIDCADKIVLGDLPGPWLKVVSLGDYEQARAP